MVKKFFVNREGNAVLKKPRQRAILSAAIERAFIPIPYFETPADLAAVGGIGHTMIFDIECYWNYFLIGFMHLESGRYISLEVSPDSQMDLALLNWIMWNFRLISFNGNKYDVPMMLLALRGYDNKRLKECSNRIVGNQSENIPGMTIMEIIETFALRIPEIDHIDLIEVCPLSGSLKLYAARLFAKRIQDLPYDHNKELTYAEAQQVKNYCLGSDIPATALIFNELSEQIKLRYELNKTYQGIDSRSKSDAQIAETAFKSEIKRLTGKAVSKHSIKPGETFQYIVPEFVSFQTPMMQRVLELIRNARFTTDNAGAPVWPIGLGELEKGKDGKDRWVLKVKIGDSLYTMGMGGLHSNEKTKAHRASDTEELHDDDVESYYPRIILNQRLFPKHIGEVFLEVYNIFVNTRISAKGLSKKFKKLLDKVNELAQKAISDSLKIVINGSFGKLGSFWSRIYAPDLMLQVTISGQLCLLMLIEEFELNGIPVVSANTDGIVTKPPKSKLELKEKIIKAWENHTGFKTERTNYSALYSRDINNYIAVKTPDEKGEVKLKFKGAYLNPWADSELAIFRFHKNPRTTICIEAVEQFIINKTPLELTIRECKDIRKFTACQQVDGGAHKDGVFLGKVVRWYYAQDMKGSINRVGTDNKVNETEGAKPLMDLPDEFPEDIDYGWYIEKANTILFDIGFYERPKLVGLFD